MYTVGQQLDQPPQGQDEQGQEVWRLLDEAFREAADWQDPEPPPPMTAGQALQKQIELASYMLRRNLESVRPKCFRDNFYRIVSQEVLEPAWKLAETDAEAAFRLYLSADDPVYRVEVMGRSLVGCAPWWVIVIWVILIAAILATLVFGFLWLVG